MISAYNITDRDLSTVVILTFLQKCGIIMVQRDTQYLKCIGLGASSGAIAGGEHIPRHFLFIKMKELSIFIDESGDFGQTVNQSPYYIVTLVFHDQSDDITENIARLKHWLSDVGINDEYIHTHPIIRKEDPYHNLSIDERRKILNKMLRFTMGCPIKYFNIIVNKRECKNKHFLSANIAKQLSRFIDEIRNSFLR